MKLLKLMTAAAGLTIAVALVAPNAFALGGMAFGLSAPYGIPNSEVPARMAGAPVGAMEAQAMSHGVTNYAAGPDGFLYHRDRKEHRIEKTREAKTVVARQIADARVQGFNVAKAEADDALAYNALADGNRGAAMSYYGEAEQQLRHIGYPAAQLASR